MTAQLIAPVIPSRGLVAARSGGKAGPVRRLPLAAAAAEAPVLPDEVVYGFGRMDVSGRVGDRAIVCALAAAAAGAGDSGFPALVVDDGRGVLAGRRQGISG